MCKCVHTGNMQKEKQCFSVEGFQPENNEVSLSLSDSFLFSLSLLSPPAPKRSPVTPGGFAVHTLAWCSCSGGPCPLSCPRLPATHEDPEGGNENIGISHKMSNKRRHGWLHLCRMISHSIPTLVCSVFSWSNGVSVVKMSQSHTFLSQKFEKTEPHIAGFPLPTLPYSLMCGGVIHAVSTNTHTADGRQRLATHSEEVTHTFNTHNHTHLNPLVVDAFTGNQPPWLLACLSVSMKTHTHAHTHCAQIPPFLHSHFWVFPSSQHKTNSYKYIPCLYQYMCEEARFCTRVDIYMWEKHFCSHYVRLEKLVVVRKHRKPHWKVRKHIIIAITEHQSVPGVICMPKMLCSRGGKYGCDVLCPQDNKTLLQYHHICSPDRPVWNDIQQSPPQGSLQQ